MSKIISESHEVFIDTQGIVHIRVLENAHVDITKMHQMNENIKKLAGGKKILALVDARPFHTMTPEATAYLKKEMIDKTRLASAIISNHLATRLLVDNISKVQKAKSPIRMFSSEVQARAWLMSVKNKGKKK